MSQMLAKKEPCIGLIDHHPSRGLTTSPKASSLSFSLEATTHRKAAN